MCVENNISSVKRFDLSLRRSLVCGVAAGALLAGAGAAWAQSSDDTSIETVTVTGYRASLEKSLDIKRESDTMVDAITAEDIGKFPDSNLAEALQRLPGVAVDRDNGEGRTITVRGLGSNFTRVTLNGLEALSTAGASSSGTAPNRDRGFDFNTFAAELFSSLKVYKSGAADTEEGSLGATVALYTPRPLDYGQKFVFGAQNAYYEQGKAFNPRIVALASDTFLGGRLGFLVSAAYTIRHQYIDSYSRSPGQSDFTYRGSNFTEDFKSATDSSGKLYSSKINDTLVGRNGFAAPAGTPCNGTVAGSNGVVPGDNITDAAYCAALSGSNPAAYALVNSPQGWTYTNEVTKTGSTNSTVTSPGSLVLIPALPSLNHEDLYQERIGLTGSVQYQMDDDTLFTVDALFSSAYQDALNLQISPISLNRNNTNTTLLTASTSSSSSTLSGLFTNCTEQIGSPTQADIACPGGTTNPLSAKITNQESPIAYYTDPRYGYATNGSGAIAAAIASIGRPAIKLIDAKVQAGNPYGAANYLVLDNVSSRSGADQAYYTTQFSQYSLNATHNFSDSFRMDTTVGWSHSYDHQTGLLAEVNHMDNDYANTGQYFVYDSTKGGDMPYMSFGFNVADPNQWTFVKNFSALRHYEYYVDNKYRNLAVNFTYDVSDQLSVEGGLSYRIFDFATSYYQRGMKDVTNPSFQEVGVTTAQMTSVINWGSGLQVPAGMPTSFVVPNLKAYEAAIGFNCNCLNKYGDWRITNLFNPASTGTAGQTYEVSEHDKSYYGQFDLKDIMIFGNPLRGDIGARLVQTFVGTQGHGLQGDILTASNSYNDFLPSANLVYNLEDDMLLRLSGAKVMARPSLGLMAPSITAMSIPSGAGATTGATMATGNPDLQPYRGKTVDLGWEWYFDKGAILSVTGFVKWISSAPQTVVSSGHINDYLSQAQLQAVESYYYRLCNAQTPADPTCTATADASNLNIITYLSGNNAINVTEALNGPGGVLQGLEVNYQQHLDFVPAWFGGDGFGIYANYTKIHSKQHYIINSTSKGNTYGDGPWNGASPDAWNLTVYYDGPNWEARVSSAFRSGYLYTYPVAGGSDVLGYGNSPLVNDFGYSKNTLNLDLSADYNITDYAVVTLDALNLTAQPDRRWAYVSAPQITNDAANGRQIFLGFRLNF